MAKLKKFSSPSGGTKVYKLISISLRGGGGRSVKVAHEVGGVRVTGSWEINRGLE